MIAVPVGFTVAWTGLNHDVRYVLGCLRTGGAGGLSATEIFVHRPMYYRLALSGLDSLSFGPFAVREALIRVFALVVVALVAFWLRSALATRLPAAQATGVAAAVGVALALAPNWAFLQPEWLAGVVAVAAVAATLRFSGGWVLGGVLLAMVVLLKYTTATTALLAIGVIAVLDRRRALWAVVAAVPAGAALFGLAVLMEPREWRWFWELPALNPPNPLTSGMDLATGRALALTVANEALLTPMIAVLPVVLVLLVRLKMRVWWPLLGAAVVVGGALVQAQWFQYHLVMLDVLAAGLWGLAVTRWRAEHGQLPWVLLGTTAVLGIAVPALTAASLEWRVAHGTVVYAVLAVVVLAAAALSVRFRGGAGGPGWAVALVALVALVVSVWPWSPYSFDGVHADYTNASRVAATRDGLAQLAEVRDRIGPDTRVVYLAFGDMDYLLGNPTGCRYPSPVFLQRGTYRAGVTDLVSYRENLACLNDPSAKWLVVQPSWIDISALDINQYACAHAITAGGLQFCPRR